MDASDGGKLPASSPPFGVLALFDQFDLLEDLAEARGLQVGLVDSRAGGEVGLAARLAAVLVLPLVVPGVARAAVERRAGVVVVTGLVVASFVAQRGGLGVLVALALDLG